MKHRNLEILREHYINVPDFIVVDGKEELDLSFSKEELFAVRSSFEVEDNDENSFAGQFDTFLNINRRDVSFYIDKVKESYKKIKYHKYGIKSNCPGNDTVRLFRCYFHSKSNWNFK